jgi:hypothetical protein
MPCAAHPRGTTPNALPPYDDKIQNDPCGLKALTSVAGVNVAAENLCLVHWTAKHGQIDLKAPLVVEP